MRVGLLRCLSLRGSLLVSVVFSMPIFYSPNLFNLIIYYIMFWFVEDILWMKF